MIQPFHELASRADQRRIRSTLSSTSSLGLSMTDIVQRGLVERPEQETAIMRVEPPSFAERVFQALVDAKIWTSKVAMHLDRATRDRFFRQLDLLHDCDEWFGEENPVKLASYRSFVRFMLMVGGSSKPALALAPSGDLIAVWQAATGRLTIEFTSDQSANWVVSRKLELGNERAAGTTLLSRLSQVLAPYNPEAWLANVE